MSSQDKYKLSEGITDFDSNNIKFLSNKDKSSYNIEEIIHGWINSKQAGVRKETSSHAHLESEEMKEKFIQRSESERAYRIGIIKNLQLEDKIKEDLLKNIIVDEFLLEDPQIKSLQQEKLKVEKNIKILLYLSVFYSFLVFGQYFDQRLNKFNNIKDLINNKPRKSDFRLRYHMLAYSLLFCGFAFFYSQHNKIVKTYSVYMKEKYLSLTDDDLSKYKFHLKL